MRVDICCELLINCGKDEGGVVNSGERGKQE